MRSILVCAALAAAGTAWSETAVAPVRADPLLGDTVAMLRINDPRWIDREVTKFAATLGIDPAPMRSDLSRLLFRSRSLDGIDLTRPAVLAWRSGPAPLIAIIPLSNRRAFLDSFGAASGDEAPLIRIGERDGTAVFSQNGNEGLIEYRLLVSDNAAFLARTTQECRALSANPPPVSLNDAPLAFIAGPAFLKRPASDPTLLLPADPASAVRTRLREVSSRGWAELAPQLASFTLELRPEGENAIRVGGSLQALPDSQLAVWIGNQRNQPSRLAALVRGAASFLTISGTVAWQGQAERVGQVVGDGVKPAYGAKWTAAADELWHSMWAIADRSGPFAAAFDLDFQGGQLRNEWRYLCDQPRAQDQISLANTFVQTLTASPGEGVSAGGATGFRQRGVIGQSPSDTATLANERYVAGVQSMLRDALAVAGELMQRSQAVAPPEGVPAVLSLGVNLTPLLRALAQAAGGTLQQVLPAADFTVAVKAASPTQLSLEAVVPAQKVAQLVRDSGINQPANTR
jgi:hypothetical protein